MNSDSRSSSIVLGLLGVALAIGLTASSCGGPPAVPTLDLGKADLAKEDGPKGNCGPSNCNGCCSQGVCLPGDALDACGVGGSQCDACSGTNTCVAGVCQSACGPQTCDGCCYTEAGTGAVKCNAAGETDAGNCGIGGATCESCNGGTCSNGTCTTASCKASCPSGCCTSSGTCQTTLSNTQCGSNGDTCVDCTARLQTCSSGACVVDPTSRWDLQLISAEVPSKDGNGEDWDSGSGTSILPDVFVTFELGGGSSTDSTVIDNTLTPSWSPVAVMASNVTATQLKQSSNKLSVWDNDAWPNANDFVDRCSMAFQDFQFGTGVRSLVCSAHATGENLPGVGYKVRVKLVPH